MEALLFPGLRRPGKRSASNGGLKNTQGGETKLSSFCLFPIISTKYNISLRWQDTLVR